MKRTAGRRSHLAWTGIVAVTLTLVLMGAQCPQPGGGNQAPTANAGTDQTVAPGVLVTLMGTGTDPNGDTLSFAWAQTAGTTVTLSSTTSATTTFTAPAAAGVLTFTLTVNDGKGGTATDSVNVTVTTTPPPAVTPQLFIANLGNSVTSYVNPATVNGNIAPNTNLAGANTQLNVPADIVVDTAGALLAANNIGASITSYAGAANANGNIAPTRNVQGANTQLVATGPASLAINANNDVLFVSEIGAAPKILIFTSVSEAGFTGNLAPTRTITNAALTVPIGINLDSSGNLYVANLATNTILVYANAANLNGDVAPTRTITATPAFNNPFDVFIDKDDRMYVVNQTGARVDVFAGAKGLNGAVPPTSTLTVNGATDLTAIVVDKAGQGFIVDRTANTIFSYDNIANLNGARTADRTIVGTNTLLINPIRLFLVE
jgi:hypothetical protein